MHLGLTDTSPEIVSLRASSLVYQATLLGRSVTEKLT